MTSTIHSTAKILVLHGPNLNLLGQREPEVYGKVSLENIDQELTQKAKQRGIELTCCQCNSEGTLIERIHDAQNEAVSHIIINPAGYTHTSVALRDALLAVAIPFIEVHLSNVHAREQFRQHSYFSDIAIGTIAGLGPQSYLLAFEYLADLTTHS